MEINLLTTELIDAIKVLDKVKVNTKLPVLDNIKITADDNGISLMKTSIETSIKYNLPGEVIKPGSMLFSLTSVIKKIKESYITLSDNSIFTNKKNIEFPTLFKVNEYPTEPEFSNDDFAFETTESELKEMLGVKYATAKDDTRPILKGVCFKGNEVCALDGFRVSIRKGAYENPNKSTFIVPADVIKIIDSVLSKTTNPVKVYFSRWHAKFTIGSIEITSRLLEGDYIKYDSIIPKDNKYHLTVSKKELLEELNFINSLGKKHMKVSFAEDKLILMIHGGSNNIQCKVNCIYNKTAYATNNYYIPEFFIGFDSKFLEEAVKNTPGDTLQLMLNSSVSPCTVIGDKGLELILPVRFANAA